MGWPAELEVIDAWMRSWLGSDWLRGPKDCGDLQQHLARRHGFSGAMEAAVSRLVPEPLEIEVEIHPHAVEQFRERTGCARPDRWIRAALRRRLSAATEVKLKPQYRATQIMAHHFTPARYYRDPSGLIFVVEHTGLLRTVHKGEAGKWRMK